MASLFIVTLITLLIQSTLANLTGDFNLEVVVPFDKRKELNGAQIVLASVPPAEPSLYLNLGILRPKTQPPPTTYPFTLDDDGRLSYKTDNGPIILVFPSENTADDGKLRSEAWQLKTLMMPNDEKVMRTHSTPLIPARDVNWQTESDGSQYVKVRGIPKDHRFTFTWTSCPVPSPDPSLQGGGFIAARPDKSNEEAKLLPLTWGAKRTGPKRKKPYTNDCTELWLKMNFKP